jgi:hypothetical protein
MIFSFLMSTLSSFVVNPGSGGVWGIIIVVAIALGLAYLLYVVYVFSPNARITREMWVELIYDRKNKSVIDDPFDGYQPQKLAWQAFERYRKAHTKESEELIDAGVNPDDTEKHILTEMLEYLIVLALHGDQMGLGRKGTAKDKTITQLPPGLEGNRIISFFKELESTDIVDRGMQQLDLILPSDFEIDYDSPLPELPGDPNGFRIKFSGSGCDITLTARMSSHWPINSMMTGPAPILQNVYIRKYHHEKLLASFPGLWVASFRVRIAAKFKLRLGLFPTFAYMDWADGWIARFIGGGPFGGFDFAELQKRNAARTNADMYETVKLIDARLARDSSVQGTQDDSRHDDSSAK